MTEQDIDLFCQGIRNDLKNEGGSFDSIKANVAHLVRHVELETRNRIRRALLDPTTAGRLDKAQTDAEYRKIIEEVTR